MYLILTAGRILELNYGEEGFALSLGNWLTKRNQNAMVMGSGFASVKTRYFSKSDTEETKINKTKTRTLNPPYFIYLLSRQFLSLLWIIKILSINREIKIKLIHVIDTGYAGMAAIIAGKILKIPVIVDSHGIRHRSLAQILKGRFSKILLKFEYNMEIFTLRNADSVLGKNPEIKDYYEKLLGKTVEYIP